MEHTFTISKKLKSFQTCITPNIIFDDKNTYQIHCQLTLHCDQKYANHTTITVACINGNCIGHKIDTIFSDLQMDDFIDESCFNISMDKPNLYINILAKKKCDIDIFATIKIIIF